jgi:hypothetical protein
MFKKLMSKEYIKKNCNKNIIYYKKRIVKHKKDY